MPTLKVSPSSATAWRYASSTMLRLTVTPDYVVEVRPSIRKESDGPMLIVGLQQIHGTKIYLPESAEQQPDRDRLARRYDVFRQAS
jgi:putative restriction endonuclease